MRKYRVEITATAESDILEVFKYISSDSKTEAIKWVEEIERQIESLEKFPLRCSIIPEAQELGKEYRHMLHGNYRTVFKVEGAKVIIMRVIHGARLLNLKVFEK